jgi:hypothetical protein
MEGSGCRLIGVLSRGLLEGLRKATTNFSQDTRRPGRDSIRASPEQLMLDQPPRSLVQRTVAFRSVVK